MFATFDAAALKNKHHERSPAPLRQHNFNSLFFCKTTALNSDVKMYSYKMEMENQEASQQNRLRRKESQRDHNPPELNLGREQLMSAVAS